MSIRCPGTNGLKSIHPIIRAIRTTAHAVADDAETRTRSDVESEVNEGGTRGSGEVVDVVGPLGGFSKA